MPYNPFFRNPNRQDTPDKQQFQNKQVYPDKAINNNSHENNVSQRYPNTQRHLEGQSYPDSPRNLDNLRYPDNQRNSNNQRNPDNQRIFNKLSSLDSQRKPQTNLYPNHQRYSAAQFPISRQPSISIDPPDNIPEGRDSGASSPLPAKPQQDQRMPQRMPQRIPSTLPVPGGMRRDPRRIPEPIDDDYYPRPSVPDTFPPMWPEEPYPTLPDYEPIDEYEPETTYPRPRRRTPSRKEQPTSPVRQQPPPYESDTFVQNGQQYVCEWVYCCRPVDAKMPERLEPNADEDYLDYVIWQDDTFPEYKVDKCNSTLGFCMSTRESTFSVIARIIYPKDITGEIRREIEDCLELATEAAYASILAQIAAMEAVPESIPAVIPTMLKTAFIVGKETFFECIREKASYEFLIGKLRFSVFHNQTSNEGWRNINERDVLKLLEKIYLHQTGLALIPGVGSFDDLADKIGLNRVDLEGIFRNAGKSVTEVADKLKEKAKGLGEELEGLKGRLPKSPF